MSWCGDSGGRDVVKSKSAPSPAWAPDAIDRAILQHLQDEARITHSELAARVKLSTPGLQKRLRKLEESGVVERYVAQLNRKLLGYDLLCFIQVTLHRHEPRAVDRFATLVEKMPEVLECFHITGGYDYLLRVVVRNTAHLE
jgi:Lrp/AsnC family transcriptional regulator, leucine-responsive regulatory protein